MAGDRFNAGMHRCGAWRRTTNKLNQEEWIRPDETVTEQLRVTWAARVVCYGPTTWGWQVWDPGEMDAFGRVVQAGYTAKSGSEMNMEAAMAACDSRLGRWWFVDGAQATEAEVAELLRLAEMLP